MSVIKFERDFSTLFNWDTSEQPTTEQEYQNAVKNWTQTEMNLVDTLLWQPTTEYATGNIIKTPSLPSQYVLRCTEAGTSGSTEPSYSGASVGDTIIDGTVEWVIVSLATGNVADVDAGNIGVNAEVDNSEAWASAIGGGAVAEDDGRLVKGSTVYAVTSELASDIATNTEAIEDNTEAIAQHTTDIDIADKRISNIEKLLQGNLYDYDTDDDAAYTKSVPQGAMPYASLEQIGGKTLVWNQLSSMIASSMVVTSNGVTFTFDSNALTCTLSGTASGGNAVAARGVNVVQGHKYLLIGCPSGGSGSTYYQAVSGQTADLGNGSIFTESMGGTRYIIITVANGTNADGLVFRSLLFNLTLMFGAGNEPTTVEQFREMFPSDYYEYNAGTLLSAGVSEVESIGINLFDKSTAQVGYIRDSDGTQITGTTAADASLCTGYISVQPNTSYYLLNNTPNGNWGAWYDINKTFISGFTGLGTRTSPANAYYVRMTIRYNNNVGSPDGFCLNKSNASYNGNYYPYNGHTYPIPAEIQSLEGYGWSAGSVYNYIDYERKVFVKNVGRVDLGTLTWGYVSQYGVFNANFGYTDSTKNMINNPSGIACQRYAFKGIYAELTDVSCGYIYYKNMAVKDESFNGDATAFKTAMSGVYAYYPLATPIETDISQYLTDDNLIQVESGGTLTFPNSNGDNYRIPVPSTEECMINLQEAVSNG